MSTELTLYKIEDDLRALLDTEEGMEQDDEARLQILQEIAEKSEQAIKKRDNVIRFLRHLEMQIEAVDQEIDRLEELKHSWQKGKERVEKYVARVIAENVPEPKRGRPKLEGTIGVLTLRKAPDRVEIKDGAVLPPEYMDLVVTLRASQWEALRRMADLCASQGDLTMGQVLEQLDSARRVPRKKDIRAAIKAGREVPGADLVFGEDRVVVR